MRVRNTLICVFLLSLQDGSPGVHSRSVFLGTEGESITVYCFSTVSESWMSFCREQCKLESVLIATTVLRARRGRYFIEKRRTGPDSKGDVYVTISQLSKSDSGQYTCETYDSKQKSRSLEIRVVDALLDGNPPVEKSLYERAGGNLMVACAHSYYNSRTFFCRGKCTKYGVLVQTFGVKVQSGRYSIDVVEGYLYVSITQLTGSDSGVYRCGMDSREFYRRFEEDITDYRQFQLVVTDDPTTVGPDVRISTPVQSASSPTSPNGTSKTAGWTLYLIVILVIAVIISASALTIICVRRRTKPAGVKTGGNPDSTNMEVALYENCPPVAAPEDSTYQSLDPACRAPDQTYLTLTHTKHTR